MDELAALDLVAAAVPNAGDDAAVIGDIVLTTDMLHERTDFPTGTTPYTMGWRAVGASLSDVAAMGAGEPAAVAIYGAPEFERSTLEAFLAGARDVCDQVDGRYVGGDLDIHQEITIPTTAVGWSTAPGAPVHRSGAAVGDRICVTGNLGRTAAALEQFERGETERANDLFQFSPRVAAGESLAQHATAMMDSSDGLARSLHQLGAASDCGVTIDSQAVPVHSELQDLLDDPLDAAIYIGEDFELVCTIPPQSVDTARAAVSTPLSTIGTVEPPEAGITIDADPLPDRGYTHDG